MITDPHKAAPELPFGHLNKAWVEYQKNLQPDGETWTFAMTWEYGRRGTRKVEGYVAVKDGRIGPHFITMQRSLDKTN